MDLKFFLGCNSPSGFYSCFEEFTRSASRLYILKGGPGCGKSTMMKRIGTHAEALGADVVRIPCGSDPDSLDGVWIRNTNTLYVDGTAPHVVEPVCPGAVDGIIDMGTAWNENMMARRREEVSAMQTAIAEKYDGAWSLLSAAAGIRRAMYEELKKSADIYKLTRRSRRIITSHIPAAAKTEKGRLIDIFTSALTCDGVLILNSYPEWEVTELYDPYDIGGSITSGTASAAVNAGYEVFAAHDPMDPSGMPLQVIIPELKYVLMRTGNVFSRSEGRRRIRLDGFVDPDKAQNVSRDERRVYLFLIRAAQQRLAAAKKLHDGLELIYRDCIDYSVTDAIVEKELKRMEESIL